MHLLEGPMFGGKTTTLIGLYEYHNGVDRARPTLIKARRDTRYGPTAVIPHGQPRSSGWEANCVVDRLSEADIGKAHTVLIDELHFFDADNFTDTLRTLRKWYLQGILVVATTLNKGSDGKDFFKFRLDAAQIPYTVQLVRGKCAYPGCSKESEMTARTAAFDGNWVGGQEAYQPCCAEHHAVMDVFVAPEALVSNWGELAA